VGEGPNRHELLLIGARGDIPAPAMGTQWPSVIEAPIRRHSEMPAAVFELIESYYPSLPKIELHARGRFRPGWDVWGNEAPHPLSNAQTPRTRRDATRDRRTPHRRCTLHRTISPSRTRMCCWGPILTQSSGDPSCRADAATCLIPLALPLSDPRRALLPEDRPIGTAHGTAPRHRQVIVTPRAVRVPHICLLPQTATQCQVGLSLRNFRGVIDVADRSSALAHGLLRPAAMHP
jgi:hypothetical protein